MIARVLTAVEGDLEAMNAAWSQDALAAVMEEMEAVGPAGIEVRSAVAAVLNAQDERLSSMGNRVSAGLVGLESAVDCFEAAQDGMLEQCQSQMLAAACPGVSRRRRRPAQQPLR